MAVITNQKAHMLLIFSKWDEVKKKHWISTEEIISEVNLIQKESITLTTIYLGTSWYHNRVILSV